MNKVCGVDDDPMLKLRDREKKPNGVVLCYVDPCTTNSQSCLLLVFTPQKIITWLEFVCF